MVDGYCSDSWASHICMIHIPIGSVLSPWTLHRRLDDPLELCNRIYVVLGKRCWMLHSHVIIVMSKILEVTTRCCMLAICEEPIWQFQNGVPLGVSIPIKQLHVTTWDSSIYNVANSCHTPRKHSDLAQKRIHGLCGIMFTSVYDYCEKDECDSVLEL